MKKSIIFGALIVIIISFATTFYFQHQAFSEQKTTIKSNFAKKQKKSDQQIKDLQNKNAELEKTIKTNEEKTNALQSELDSVKAEKEQSVATSQEVTETPVEEIADTDTPATQQEESVTPVTEAPKEKTNAAGQTYQQRYDELVTRMNSGDTTLGYREILKIMQEEFPQ